VLIYSERKDSLMKKMLQLSLIIVFVICAGNILAAQEGSQPLQEQPDPTQNATIGETKTVIINNKIVAPEKATTVAEASSGILIQRKQDELVLLKKLIREIEEPQDGVDEFIRQEKMRLLIEKVNRNLDIIESARKEQEKQMEIIESQRAILNQQRTLPKR